MSGLGHDEDAATLAEALAFVEEFALPPVDIGIDLWESVGVGHGGYSPVIELKPKLKPKRVRDPSADARRREKRKEEREALRQQAKDLERELTKIRRAFRLRSVASDAGDGDHSDRQRMTKRAALKWHRALAVEHRRRCEAEELNRELKCAVAAQADKLRAVRQCLELSSGIPEVVWPAPSPFLSALALPKIVNELQSTVTQLHQEACASWDPLLSRSASRDFSTRSDPQVGAYCEARAYSPLGRSLADVAALMKLVYLRDKFPIPPESLQPGKVTALTKQIVMDWTMDNKHVHFHCVFLIQWSQEADRVVLAFSSLLFHPSGAFCFREGGWTIVQQSLSDPCACISQFCVRAASQTLGNDGSTLSPELQEEQAVAMAVLSSKAQIKSEQIQHRLLVDTGREDLARLLPAPRSVDSISWTAQTLGRSLTVLGDAK